MRAIHMNTYGGPEVLELAEAATPAPGPGEVRVKAAAIGVNPADWKRRAGWFKDMAPLSFPHVLGYDAAGVVDAVGEGVDDLAAGDRVVLLTLMKQGAYAEYVVALSAATAKIPPNLDFGAAAALPTAGLTGVQLIEEHVRPVAGQTVLVTGAVGAVGRFAVYTAKRLGARVVAAVRASQADEARTLGVDDVAVLGGADWAGAPFDAVADTVGGREVAKLCRHVKACGVIATVSTTPIDPTGLPSKPIFIALHPDKEQLGRIAEAVALGDITVPIARRLPMAQAGEAHRLVEAGGVGGKIILEP